MHDLRRSGSEVLQALVQALVQALLGALLQALLQALFSVARLVGISIDAVLDGTYVPGSCPKCGHVPTAYEAI